MSSKGNRLWYSMVFLAAFPFGQRRPRGTRLPCKILPWPWARNSERKEPMWSWVRACRFSAWRDVADPSNILQVGRAGFVVYGGWSMWVIGTKYYWVFLWMIFCSSSEYNIVWACLGWFMLILSNTQTLMSWHTHGIHYVSSLWSCSETGDDPYLGSELTRAYVKGVQSQGVLGIVKHWVFNSQETRRGATDRGSRRGRCTKYGFNGIVNFSI